MADPMKINTPPARNHAVGIRSIIYTYRVKHRSKEREKETKNKWLPSEFRGVSANRLYIFNHSPIYLITTC